VRVLGAGRYVHLLLYAVLEIVDGLLWIVFAMLGGEWLGSTIQYDVQITEFAGSYLPRNHQKHYV
jgi:hypothetical protein